MKNTMKSLVFIVSFFSFLILISLSNYILYPLFNNFQQVIYISYVFTALSFIALLFVQAYTRRIYVNKLLRNSNILFKVKCEAARPIDKVLLYVLPAIAVFYPLIAKRVFDTYTIAQLLIFAALIAAIEIILLFTKRTMEASITDRGIAISGIDIRIELPINANYPNASGFYPYERLLSFLFVNNEVFIEQGYDLSVIKFKCSPEEARMLKGLLLKNGVEETRGH